MTTAPLIIDTRIAVFRQKQIRRLIYKNEWWFIVEDVASALIDSHDPKQYIQRMKSRDPELAKGWVQIVHTLPIKTFGGTQSMLCANTEGIFRIIQSIPSSRAELLNFFLKICHYKINQFPRFGLSLHFFPILPIYRLIN